MWIAKTFWLYVRVILVIKFMRNTIIDSQISPDGSSSGGNSQRGLVVTLIFAVLIVVVGSFGAIWFMNQKKIKTTTLLNDKNDLSLERVALSSALSNSVKSVPQDSFITKNLASQLSKQVASSTSSVTQKTTSTSTTQPTTSTQKATVKSLVTQTVTRPPTAAELNMANALKQASTK